MGIEIVYKYFLEVKEVRSIVILAKFKGESMNIYSRLLKLYRTNSHKTPKEDFTTEILVGIFDKYPSLLQDYVNDFLKIEGENFKVFSQGCYTLESSNDCRVDIVIENDEKIIFIENKVDSSEGEGQLEKYSNFLTSLSKKEGHLFYCTKKIEEKEKNIPNFKQFRWKDIYDYYKNKESEIEIIIDFLDFLEEEGIVMTKKFNFTDMLVMENIVETIAKMDEVLNEAGEHLEKNFVKCIKYSGRSTQIGRNNMYSTYSTCVLEGSGYTDISANFNFNKEKFEVPNLELTMWIDQKSEYYSCFEKYKEELKNLNLYYYVYDNGIVINTYKPIQDFLSSENQIEDMKYWFKEKIEVMYELKNRTPDFGWR